MQQQNIYKLDFKKILLFPISLSRFFKLLGCFCPLCFKDCVTSQLILNMFYFNIVLQGEYTGTSLAKILVSCHVFVSQA